MPKPTQKPRFHRAWLSDPPGIMVMARADGAFLQAGAQVLLVLAVVEKEFAIELDEVEAARPVPPAAPGLPPQWETKRFPLARARDVARSTAVATQHGEIPVGDTMVEALEEHLRLAREEIRRGPALILPGAVH